MLKKTKYTFIALFLLVSTFMTNICAAITFTPDFELKSESAVLINLDTGTTVYAKNPDIKQSPTQLAQIMTAIICLENCDDITNTIITADNELYADLYAYGYPEDITYGDIYNGDKLSVEDYLYALMLSSSCEAANILAYYFGDNSIKAFVQMMNEKAKEIGAVNTNFTNPHGLYNQIQVTTATDMALITQYALQNPKFVEIATTQSRTPSNPNTHNNHYENWCWNHTNVMMSPYSDYYDENIKGIKTGNLERAGRNLITMCEYNGSNYLVILMNAPFEKDIETGKHIFHHLNDAANLFNWAFEHISYQTLVNDNEEITEIPVLFGTKDKNYVLLKPSSSFSSLWLDSATLEIEPVPVEYAVAPIQKNQVLGHINLKLDGNIIGTLDLIAVDNVERSSSKFNITVAKQFIHSKWLKNGLIISSILSLIYILICIYAYRISRKRKPVKGIYNKKSSSRSATIHKKRPNRRR